MSPANSFPAPTRLHDSLQGWGQQQPQLARAYVRLTPPILQPRHNLVSRRHGAVAQEKQALPSGSRHQNVRGSGVELVEVAVDVHASDGAHELEPVEGHNLGVVRMSPTMRGSGRRTKVMHQDADVAVQYVYIDDEKDGGAQKQSVGPK